MDAFEIFIPMNVAITNLEFGDVLSVLACNGSQYDVSLKNETFFGYFRLQRNISLDLILPQMPIALQGMQWQCISIIKGFEELKQDLSKSHNKKKLNAYKLLELLNALLLDKKLWAVSIIPQYDYKISKCIINGNLHTVFNRTLKAITNTQEPFLIWHKS
jgi:hypothetical protein